MTTGMKIGLSIFAFFLISVISIVGYTVSGKFTAEKKEKDIIYGDKNMQNVHSRVEKIVSTSGLTVQNFSKTKIDAINAKVKQYADKPDMMMMWIKENPQNIDSKIWEKFQDSMEKQYTDFDNEQKQVIAHGQAYDTWLTSTYHGAWTAIVFDYPTLNTKRIMDRVIQTETTKETFDTGIDKAVAVF